MSPPLFSPTEAYFVLSRIISWADGEQQEAEMDALTTLRMVEQLDEAVYDKLGGDDEDLFQQAITALQEQPESVRARACAWMLMTAMVAHFGPITTGEVTYQNTLANVSPEERQWITRAQKALHVVESDLETAMRRIPRIRKID